MARSYKKELLANCCVAGCLARGTFRRSPLLGPLHRRHVLSLLHLGHHRCKFYVKLFSESHLTRLIWFTS